MAHTLVARRPAIKKVLSPISDKNMSENAARNPDLPSMDLFAVACDESQ